MKSSHPIITLLGSNSGNNLGDAAIMSGIMDVLTEELPTAEFLVPSTRPSFVDKNYGRRYNVRGVNVMPWTGSVRLAGLTTINCLRKSDVALICDGIIFGKKFFNPLFNFLITLIVLVPFAKLMRCKIVLYSCGIGPFPVALSRPAARFLMNAADLVIMRENDSKALAEKLGVTKPIQVTGDAAFLNPVSSDKRAQDLCKLLGVPLDKPLLGINVTKYLDGWLEADERVESRDQFLQTLATGIRAAQSKVREMFQPVLFSTHPMDEAFTHELAAKISAPVVTNSVYLSHDIQAIMRRCELFMGMRFHSVVLASAVGCPLVGLIYAPKVRGYMRLLDSEKYALELAALTPENLANTLSLAWENRKDIQKEQQVVVDDLKAGARRAATSIRTRYYPELPAPRSAKNADISQFPTEWPGAVSNL
jgi:polysaccharide pyruvyl transferase WcaK-like protein